MTLGFPVGYSEINLNIHPTSILNYCRNYARFSSSARWRRPITTKKEIINGKYFDEQFDYCQRTY